MFRTLSDITTIRDPVINTPMLPSRFGIRQCSGGRRNYQMGRKWYSCDAKNNKSTQFGKKKNNETEKSILKEFKKITRGKPTIKQLFKKVKTVLKNKKDKDHKKVIKIITKLAKKHKIPLSKKGKKIPILTIWNNINKNGNVIKRRNVKKTKSETKLRTGRARFGWWDNTQREYTTGCTSQQCSTPQLTNNYPYQGNWTPYNPISRHNFGSPGRFPNAVNTPYPFTTF